MYSIDYSQLEQYVAQHNVVLIQGLWKDENHGYLDRCGYCLVSILCKLQDPKSNINSFAEAADCLGQPEELVRGLTRGFDGLTREQALEADRSRSSDAVYQQAYLLGQQSALICRTMGLLPEEEPC